MPWAPRGATTHEEVKHVDTLLAGSVHDRHHAFGESLTALALATERPPTPKDEGPEFALGVIVGRFHAVASHEGPQCVLVREDVGTRPPQTWNICRDSTLQHLLEAASTLGYICPNEFEERHAAVAA